MDLGLTGKVIMVGGASRGLGFAVAREVAREGGRVSMVARDRQAICAAAAALERETQAEILAMPLDLASADDIATWHASTLERFGAVHGLFANTGGPPAGPALAFDDGAWMSAFELLVLSAVRLVRLVVPSMQAAGGGAIVVSSSSSVKEPIPNLALSNVLRASVAALAKTLASELAPSGIRINNLIPGRIDTDRVRSLDEIAGKRNGRTAGEQRAQSEASIPLGRYGKADEFGRVAAFLLSDACSYMTGASVQVDGGMIRSVL